MKSSRSLIAQRCLIAAAVLALALFRPGALRNLHPPMFAQGSPITLTLDSPASGSVISNTITLRATAGSTAGSITRVNFYVDGRLIGAVDGNNNPIPLPPTGFQVR